MTEAHSGPSKIAKMELCAEIVQSKKSLTIFAKSSTFVWLGFGYAYEYCCNYFEQVHILVLSITGAISKYLNWWPFIKYFRHLFKNKIKLEKAVAILRQFTIIVIIIVTIMIILVIITTKTRAKPVQLWPMVAFIVDINVFTRWATKINSFLLYATSWS